MSPRSFNSATVVDLRGFGSPAEEVDALLARIKGPFTLTQAQSTSVALGYLAEAFFVLLAAVTVLILSYNGFLRIQRPAAWFGVLMAVGLSRHALFMRYKETLGE